MNNQEHTQKVKELTEAYFSAKDKSVSDSIPELEKIVKDAYVSKNPKWQEVKENSIKSLSKAYAQQNRAEDIAKLLTDSDVRKAFKFFAKAITAKIVREILDNLGKVPNSSKLQISTCKAAISWAKEEKRTFLRQRLDTRLASLLFEAGEHTVALNIIDTLLPEVKRLDDKALLVEIQLLESKIYQARNNISKSKAALTSARTAANSIYCPILLQADLDTQSGILNAEERDYKTGFSYFYEAFEGYSSIATTTNDSNSLLALKYMLLCKIMSKMVEDISGVLSSKTALKYSGDSINSMRDVAAAYQDRSVHAFEAALDKYPKELKGDQLVEHHIGELYENLLEQHLLKIVEPFSRVEVSHVSKLLKLSREKVETKLSQMILDNRLNGIIDQGNDCLILFEQNKTDKCYPYAIETLDNYDHVIDAIFERAQELKK
eukprot:gene2270-2444_t